MLRAAIRTSRDEVVAVPDAVPVGLAESDAAAEHGAVEARRVDLDGRGEVRVGISEVQAAAVRARPGPAGRRRRREKRPESQSPGGSLGRGHRPSAYARAGRLAWRTGESAYPSRMTKVKVCGMTNLADAEHAASHGAWAIGLIHHPESPRYVQP